MPRTRTPLTRKPSMDLAGAASSCCCNNQEERVVLHISLITVTILANTLLRKDFCCGVISIIMAISSSFVIILYIVCVSIYFHDHNNNISGSSVWVGVERRSWCWCLVVYSLSPQGTYLSIYLRHHRGSSVSLSTIYNKRKFDRRCIHTDRYKEVNSNLLDRGCYIYPDVQCVPKVYNIRVLEILDSLPITSALFTNQGTNKRTTNVRRKKPFFVEP